METTGENCPEPERTPVAGEVAKLPVEIPTEAHLVEMGFTVDELTSLLWLRNWNGDKADINLINNHLYFIRGLVLEGVFNEFGISPEDDNGNWTIKPEWKDFDLGKGKKKA